MFNPTVVLGAVGHIHALLQPAVILPVGCQLVGYEASWDLCDNVAPEERAMDQAHCLRVPVKLCWLCNKWKCFMERRTHKKYELK